MAHEGRPVYIVGGGIVGAATARALRSVGTDVAIVEINPDRQAELMEDGFACAGDLLRCKPDAVILLAVPTPADSTGYDLSALQAASRSVGKSLRGASPGHVVAVRSTVAPRTLERVVVPIVEAESGLVAGRDIGFCSVPEFLREATADDDASHPAFTVIGGRDSWARRAVRTVFKQLGGEIIEFEDPAESEAVKIAHNCFNATKISFFNEVHTLLSAAGLNPQVVARVIVRTAEASWNPLYGTDGGRAFGGSCLPKDLSGFIAFANELGVGAPLLTAVREVNEALAFQADAFTV